MGWNGILGKEKINTKLRRKNSTKTIYFENRKLDEPIIKCMNNKSETTNENFICFNTKMCDIAPFRKTNKRKLESSYRRKRKEYTNNEKDIVSNSKSTHNYSRLNRPT